MPSFNKVIVMGNLTRDPEVRQVGANAVKVFFKVTMPLLMPIFVYCLITAMIGGIQMFDVPQVLTNRLGMPNRTSFTLVMYLNNYLSTSKNYGMSGAISVIIFIITGILGGIVYKFLSAQYKEPVSHRARRGGIK